MVSERMNGREAQPIAKGEEKSDRPGASPEVGLERRRHRPNSWGFLEFDIDQGSWPRPATRRAQSSAK